MPGASVDKKVRVKDILALIPDNELGKIAKKTKVNYYTKVLDGKSMLYLILYSLIEQKSNSLRTMEDIFNSPRFKFLFNLDPSKSIRHSSISERLSVIDISFFEQSYQLLYDTYSKLYNSEEQEKHQLIRVDSTMVAEAANKIEEGMTVGNKGKKARPKQIKFTVAFDGTFPCLSVPYTTQEALSEEKTIPPVVFKSALKKKNAIFVFDRGVQKRATFTELDGNDISFVTRLKLDSRFKVIEELEFNQDENVGNIKVVSDQKINLGKPNCRTYLKEEFRLIITYNESKDKKCFILTNIFDKTPQEIIEFYNRRWDIEVFFRFLKQELNFTHFTSTSQNGIKVMMYVTMIASMLVMIYKKLNKVGYKTAIRRISFELNDIITAMIVTHCGGDPSLVFR